MNFFANNIAGVTSGRSVFSAPKAVPSSREGGFDELIHPKKAPSPSPPSSQIEKNMKQYKSV